MEHLDRPILENGELYELEPNELRRMQELIYFCEDCNAFHVKEDMLSQFNVLVGENSDGCYLPGPNCCLHPKDCSYRT